MLIPGLVIAGFLLLLCALLYISIRLINKYTTTTKAARDEHIINLRVTVQLILWMIPITVILLGILGYGSYVDVKKKIGEEILIELNAAGKTKEYIDSLRIEINKLYLNAKNDANSIGAIKDSLVLPIGSIIAYRGQRDSLPSGWHLCDGTNDTPDLRDKFIMGSDFQGINSTGGQARHEFKIEFQNPLGNIKAGKVVTKGIGTGTGPVTNIIIPNEYKLFLEAESLRIKPLQNDGLPPYYTLAYIIKIH